jgi:hypothetical protein
VGETLTIDAPVVLSGTNTLTAPKFIDTANSAYFMDPAATGTSLFTAGSVTVAGTIQSTTGGFKFPDGTTQTAAASALPAGLVSFFNLTACPTGWTEFTSARGLYVVGLPSGGTLAGTSGTALTNLESRAVGQHTHAVDPPNTSVSISDPGHTHTETRKHMQNWCHTGLGCGEGDNNNPYATVNTGSTTTGISAAVNIASFDSAASGSVAGTNAPYIQLLACRKS